jgi:type I restriction enzyme S subunit
MIADLKPYAEYKESGLPWVGRVPGHWDSRRLRHACDMRVSNVDKHTKLGETPVRLCNYVEVYKSERIRESTRFMAATASEDERVRFGLRKGDVLITKDSEQWNDIGVPALVECEAPDLVCGYHLAILRARPGLHGAFLHRALESHLIAAQFHVEANGVTRYGLSHGAIQGVAIPLPPPDEQAAIVRFLDWANGRLEQAIRAKRKVIALLQEQKQAIIHRAVTRGLDPNVPLKPSGIPWLGDIPAHWEVRKLKHLTRFVNGLPFKPGDWKASGVPIIRIQNLNGSDAFNYTDRAELPEELLIQPGDLMFAWSGNRGTSFGSFQWSRAFPGYLNQHIFKLVGYTQPKRYFYYLLRAVTRHVEEQAGGIIGLVHVTKPELGSVSVPIAPVDEALAIAREIDVRTTEVEGTISRLEGEIELLREYRTRLVADVVTGKLDVREAATRLPAEAPIDSVEDDADPAGDLDSAVDEVPE